MLRSPRGFDLRRSIAEARRVFDGAIRLSPCESSFKSGLSSQAQRPVRASRWVRCNGYVTAPSDRNGIPDSASRILALVRPANSTRMRRVLNPIPAIPPSSRLCVHAPCCCTRHHRRFCTVHLEGSCCTRCWDRGSDGWIPIPKRFLPNRKCRQASRQRPKSSRRTACSRTHSSYAVINARRR